jgi:hypothetical protein
VQLCYLRYPGYALPTDAEPPATVLALVARQLRVDPAIWPQYVRRAETRREHLAELQAWLNLTPFGRSEYRRLVHRRAELAPQTDRGIALATTLVEALRQQRTGVLCEQGQPVDGKPLPHLSPPGWEHVNLTGDYIWRQSKPVERGKFRPLRPFNGA